MCLEQREQSDKLAFHSCKSSVGSSSTTAQTWDSPTAIGWEGRRLSAAACTGSRNTPTRSSALWPLRLMEELRAVMENEEMRKIDRWTARYRTAHVSFAVDADGIDPFFNVNRPENLEEARRLLGQRGAA